MSAAKRHLVVASALVTLTSFVAVASAEPKAPSLAERVQILNALKEKPAAAPAPAPAVVSTPEAAANPLASPLPEPNAVAPAHPAPTSVEQASAMPPTLPPAAVVPATVRPDLSAPEAPNTTEPSEAHLVATHSAAQAVAGTYTIKAGDSFTTIAKAKLGDAGKWTLIAKANPLVDPLRLKVGQTIRLPEPGSTVEKTVAIGHAEHSVTKLAHVGTPTHAGAPETVTVRPGESLNSIARRIYGSGTMWPAIYRLNRDKLHDPDELRPGMVLKLPAGHRR